MLQMKCTRLNAQGSGPDSVPGRQEASGQLVATKSGKAAAVDLAALVSSTFSPPHSQTSSRQPPTPIDPVLSLLLVPQSDPPGQPRRLNPIRLFICRLFLSCLSRDAIDPSRHRNSLGDTSPCHHGCPHPLPGPRAAHRRGLTSLHRSLPRNPSCSAGG
jgi:hypothetical protein